MSEDVVDPHVFREFPVEVDDGHKPGSTVEPTKLFIHENKSLSNFFHIYDNVLDESWMNFAYNYAISKSKPWGVFISMEELLGYHTVPPDESEVNPEKSIALRSAKALFSKISSTITKDVPFMSGVVVWCLVSNINSPVHYHIDYAELFRYETNEIHPPLYGGTLHLTPVSDNGEDMKGGGFMAHMGGLDHYKRFGYKGRLQPPHALDLNLQSDPLWVSAPYRANRGILFDGSLPHLSLPVTHMREGLRRVILGFNWFSHRVSECCQRAPEHSDAFNRTIRLYQALNRGGSGAAIGGGKYDSSPPEPDQKVETSNEEEILSKTTQKKKITIQDIKSNPALAKLMVLAAKKYKETQKNTA